MPQQPDIGEQLHPGARHYRAFVGATQTYDIFSHMQFSLLTLLGLREWHRLLDIGCGSLRAGKLFIVYLLPNHYFGIEPEKWLVEEGIRRELGTELVAMKNPRFLYENTFPCTEFRTEFDFVVAQSIFSHSSAAQIRRCFEQVRLCMKPETLFAASFVEGSEDYAGEEWTYPETVQYRATTIAYFAEEAGLRARRLDWFHIGGQAWFLFFLPGREPEIEHLATLNQTMALKEELSHYKMRHQRLERIERHPLFRFASSVRRLLKR